MDVDIHEWLTVVRREYLQSYIREGGATVKFLVPDDGMDRERLKLILESVAREENYAFAVVDAAQTKIHMIDHVFSEMARQIDWNNLAYSVVLRILRENGWSVPQENPLSVAHIAEANNREQHMIKQDISRLLERNIFRDYRLSQEYRIAMIRLCQSQFDPTLSTVSAETIEQWLKGELKRVSEVKSAPIFQKVARHNARHMVSSLSYWLHLAGCSGIFLVLDIERCLKMRPRPNDLGDNSRYYSLTGVYDAYEMLRELVDETDDLEYCFVTVLASREFLDPGCRRGVWRYNALKLRIWDEVRDEHRANPLGGLVRLADSSVT